MAKGKKVKTLASALFDEGYVLLNKDVGVIASNVIRTDGGRVTAGDVRAAQAVVDNWNRRKK
jgi:hypothetical protein